MRHLRIDVDMYDFNCGGLKAIIYRQLRYLPKLQSVTIKCHVVEAVRIAFTGERIGARPEDALLVIALGH